LVVDRPKVLVAIKGLGLGGAEKLIAESARYWDRSKFDYRVVYALPWKDALVSALEDLDVPVVCVGSNRGFLPRAWLRLRDLIHDQQVDLVHAHLPSVGVVSRIVSPVPVVYTEHNLAQSYRMPLRMANRASYSRNRRTIAVSNAVADSLAGYPGHHPRVVPNGVVVSVDPESASQARRELGIGDDVPLVVHVGNIRPHKGHDNLIAATSLLRSRSPSTIVVSIGGEKTPGDLARVESVAHAARLGTRLRFLGSRSDALHFLAAADVVVNPSRVEGLPVSVLEAMALSRPLVATAVGGVPSVVRHRETGLLVESGAPGELASAIDELLDDTELAEQLGRSGHELVASTYGLESMVRTVESVYMEVLDA
jgi:L-malate glycosyltransferase